MSTSQNARVRVIILTSVVALIAALFAVPAGAGGTFIDDDDSVFETATEWMAAEGITKGCNPPTNDKFCPDDNVTRGQMAAFFSRAYDLTDDGGGDKFTDDDSSIFESAIDRLATTGITKGCNPPSIDKFCPDDNMTRGQMAAFFFRGEADIDLQILSINDFHGNIATTSSAFGGVGRADFLAANMRAAEAEVDNSIIVSAGDLIGASPLISALFHDEPTIEAMNLIGLDINGVGNHEFDEGSLELLRMQNGADIRLTVTWNGSGFAGADFEFLAANVVVSATGKTVFPSYTVKSYEGVQVAFIGMTLQGTPSIVTQFGVAGLTFLDEVDTVNALLPELQAKGIEASCGSDRFDRQVRHTLGAIGQCGDRTGDCRSHRS